MPSLVIVGAQWGDEGKGKVVDLLAGESDLVARFQGGPNAGHTLVVGGEKTVLHHIPSGVLNPTAKNALGPGVIVDPITCIEEIRGLEAKGISDLPSRLVIDRDCHLILPVHRQIDGARESAASEDRKIGTTKRGIGPCWEDIVGRRGLRIGEALDADPAALSRVEAGLREKAAVLREYGHTPPTLGELLGKIQQSVQALRPYVGDARQAIQEAISSGGKVLFEGAQGTFLDPLHGTYPYVTSSPCVASAAGWGAGAPGASRGGVLGIMKAYTTRVGSGPFPTELHDEAGERLREAGAEYGATTGRPRRTGWLDLPMMRQAAQINGFTSLAITKLDVLTHLGPLQVAVARDDAGAPVYEEVAGWDEPLTGAERIEDLPAEARSYLDRIEAAVGVPIDIVSIGPGRHETILVCSPWQD